MRLPKLIRWTAIGIGGVVALLLIVSAIVIAFEITISLDRFREQIDAAATRALGRDVSIDGKIELTPALWPAMEIEGFRIANPRDWKSGDFIRLARFRVQIGILPLFKGQIRIEELTAEGIDVLLRSKPDGRTNWEFDTGSRTDEKSAPATEEPGALSISLLEVEELALYQLKVNYHDGNKDKDYVFELVEMTGAAVADEPLLLKIQGALQNQRYYINLSADPIRSLFVSEKPWFLDASAEIPGVTLNISGKIDNPMKAKGIDLILKLNGDHINDLEALTGSPLPPLGAYNIQMRLTDSETGYEFSELKGEVGDADFTGKFEADLSGERINLVAILNIKSLDVGFLFEESQSRAEPVTKKVSTGEAEKFNPEDLEFSAAVLEQLNAAIELTIDQVINSPADIRDVVFKLSIRDGALSSPMKVTFADVPFQGLLEIKDNEDIPEIKLKLSADQTRLGNLAQVLTGAEGIRGSLEKFEFNLSSEGRNILNLLENLDFKVALTQAALSYGNELKGKPVNFSLENVFIALPAGKQMRVNAKGKLLDEPFDLSFTGGNLQQLTEGEAWPIDLAAGGSGAKISVKGKIVERSNNPELNFELSGKRVGDMATWLGVSPSAKLPYAMKGRLQLTQDEWILSGLRAHLGKTSLAGGLKWKGSLDNPLITIKLGLKDVDPANFTSLFDGDNAPAKEKPKGEGLTIDMPILPQQVSVTDADIDIKINRIFLTATEIRNLSLSTRIRDGWVEHSPFQVEVADVQFKGDLSIDLRGDEPVTMFKLNSNKVDLGRLMQKLEIADGIEATVGSFEFQLLTKGANLREILDKSDLAIITRDGRWTLRDPNTDAVVEIAVIESRLGASAGQRITISLDSRIEKTPINIIIQTAKLADFVGSVEQLPLNFKVDGAGVNLEMRSNVILPISRDNLDFEIKLQGRQLDSVNELLELDLPPLGPYAFGGNLSIKPDGYYLSNLLVTVNQSRMIGSLGFETTRTPPQLTIDLTTETLQLNDFDVGDWSPMGSAPNGTESTQPAGTPAEATAQPDTGTEAVKALLSPEAMRLIDSRFSLNVREVLSGQDRLGSTVLESNLKNGRFSMDRLQLNIPGGSANVTFAYEPSDAGVAMEASAVIEQLDYGVLARHAKPESEMSGWLSLDLKLSSRAKNIAEIMHHANGYIDFAVVPENFEANLFELWAVNLLTAVLPQVDSDASSKVNCAVFRLDLKDGRLKSEAVLMDTTKMQVGGKATADFKTEEVYMALKPKAKKPEFFSLATPIEVKGTFSDFGVGVAPGGLIGTAISFITSPITVPFRRLFSDQPPADGRAACTEAMHRPHTERQE